MVGSGYASGEQGYKLVLVDKIVNNVGTYAEVLKRRFQLTDKSRSVVHDSDVRRSTAVNQQSTRASTRKGDGSDYGTNSVVSRQPGDSNSHFGSQWSPPTASNNLPNSLGSMRHVQKPRNTIRQGKRVGKISEVSPSDVPSAEGKEKDAITIRLQNRLIQAEANFNSQLKEMQRTNKQVLGEFENRLEKQIEDIISLKMKTVSNMVADTVTSRMMKAMSPLLQVTKKIQENGTEISQSSEERELDNTVNTESDTLGENSNSDKEGNKQPTDSPKQLLSALSEIETETFQQKTLQGPIHDNTQGPGNERR